MVFRRRIALTVVKSMFPTHCKEVSVKSVDFPLTAESIIRFLNGKRAYIRTKYYVFSSGDSWAVASVEKKEANDVLQDILSVHVLSLPEETAFVEAPLLDVLSASLMGRLLEETGKKAVVVQGKSDHVSFFIEEPADEVTVFDVVPPAPSKLVDLVDSVLASDMQDRFVRARTVEVDLNELAKGAVGAITMFPCRASGLRARNKALYLDETPSLTPEEVSQVTLIGCSLSARIFKAVYGSEPPELINMCPKDLVAVMGLDGPVLLKCCRVKEGFEMNGRFAVVPWGARASDVAGAMRALLR